MKGYIRNIPVDMRFGFIRASTGLDNIFLHSDDFYGDWKELVQAVIGNPNKIYVRFELEEGNKGPRAVKCERITEVNYKLEN